MRRKLAAVLCADVVGYSRLMERDEDGTLVRVKAAFASFEPVVARHNGRFVKLMGDGALIEFASAVDAVASALALQQAVAATDRELRFRMGVNLGDVIVDDGDIYGDGVNVAARLQTLAPPGGVALAQTVREHIAGKLNLALKDLGPVAMKNIERPIRVFTVLGAAPAGAASHDGRTAMCVAPFENMSGDPEQDFFSAGVTEDIVIDLSKISALRVMSAKAATGTPTRHLARQLGAAFVLEGSVRRAGDKIRLGAQLIDVTSETTIWAERYDREIRDVLSLQSDLARAVVQALKLQLHPSEHKALERRAETDPEAYRLFLLAREYSVMGSERHKALIERLCRRVVELDPENARAWALLGATLVQRRRTQNAAESGEAEIERALCLDPDLSVAHAAKAQLLIDRGAYDEASVSAAVALRLDPDAYEALTAAGRCAIMLRDFSSGISHFERAAALSPNEYIASAMVIQCYQGNGDQEGALDACRRALARIERIVAVEPDHSTSIGHGAGILALLGERERANEWASRASLLEPDNLNLQMNLVCAWAIGGDSDAALSVLERFAPCLSAELLRWMEHDNDLDSLRALPRFQAIMAKVRGQVNEAPSATSD
jgi:adenylate cyclase